MLFWEEFWVIYFCLFVLNPFSSCCILLVNFEKRKRGWFGWNFGLTDSHRIYGKEDEKGGKDLFFPLKTKLKGRF